MVEINIAMSLPFLIIQFIQSVFILYNVIQYFVLNKSKLISIREFNKVFMFLLPFVVVHIPMWILANVANSFGVQVSFSICQLIDQIAMFSTQTVFVTAMTQYLIEIQNVQWKKTATIVCYVFLTCFYLFVLIGIIVFASDKQNNAPVVLQKTSHLISKYMPVFSVVLFFISDWIIYKTIKNLARLKNVDTLYKRAFWTFNIGILIYDTIIILGIYFYPGNSYAVLNPGIGDTFVTFVFLMELFAFSRMTKKKQQNIQSVAFGLEFANTELTTYI
ncbi:Hypothetical_protein [Hexamita inflata]|uniref:Hypothetical_protein n=1 Tax=Hexamita inflata TaxID=28002 RepID=A0AA86THU5_9EUKA|nr:Hypothetical protein HINF_LOCUS6689 [Hexamita inflata]